MGSQYAIPSISSFSWKLFITHWHCIVRGCIYNISELRIESDPGFKHEVLNIFKITGGVTYIIPPGKIIQKYTMRQVTLVATSSVLY